jgi:hypothetical protein
VIEDGASDGEIRAAIETKYPKAYAFFTKAHTIVTLSAPIPPGGVGGGAANATTPVTLPDVATKGKAFPVCFRQGEFLRLRLFAAVDDATHVTQVSDANENIMYPTLPVACMTFSPSALADRSLAITFDDKGRPSHVERSAKSDIAALAAALASSAATLRDEYAATLSKLVDIDTSKRALALNDLTTKLETLKKQKDILDTQLTVEANTANFTTSLEQKQAEAALSGLQAQITLDVARASADQQRDIGQIKTALELLNKQIELLKAQIEMDKTKR